MVKSFKKAIACILAVLMVVCAMPFTALAAPGDYAPDSTLQFGTFHYSEGNWTTQPNDGKQLTVAPEVTDSDYFGLYDVPVDYTAKKNADGSVSGKLYIDKNKANKANEIDGYLTEDATEDIALGKGDYFTLSVCLDNVTDLAIYNESIQYSKNIEPAGIYKYSVTTGSGRQAKTTNYWSQGSVSEAQAKVDEAIMSGATAAKVVEWVYGGPNHVAAQSAYANYQTCNYDNGTKAEDDGSTCTDGELKTLVAVVGIDSTDVSNLYDDYYCDPATGDLESGYNYGENGRAVLETWVFKIVDDGDITFSKTTTDNVKQGYYVAKMSDGTANADYTTYAKNDENAGSEKMTFFGMNVNSGVGIPNEPEHTHSYSSEVTTQPTCTTPGVTTYTCACGDTYEDRTAPAATGHKYATTWSSDENQHWHAATCGHDEKSDTANHAGGTATCTAKAVCSTCGASYGELAEHSFTTKASETKATDATCTAAETYYVQCDNCTAVDRTKTVSVGDPAAHSFTTKASTTKATDATCTAAATYFVQCDNCTAVSNTKTVPVGDPAPHSFTTKASSQMASAATCTVAATYYVQCDNCTAVDTTKTVSVGDPTGHSFTNYVSDNNATSAKDGTKTAACDNGCGTTDTIADEGSATGVNVTVDNANDSFGTVTPAFGTTNYAVGEAVTLTAAALEDCEFVGWQVGNKLVSTDATYTFNAYVDVTVTPVFRPVDAEKISVIFYDKYSNVIASYMDKTVAEYQAEVNESFPTAPVYAGYTFAGWSKNVADIKALAESATIWAYYNEDKAQGFIVETTADATIEIDAIRGTKESDQKYVDVQFDTKATVTAPGASAWKVDDAIVGYGETYSFFVGSDILVEPVYDAVEEAPTVAMVKAYKISADSHKIMFLASMNIPDGYTLADHGFIYGKNLTAEDMVLANVGHQGAAANAGEIKKTGASTNPVEQFGISYGIKAQTGKACAVAYITFVKNGVMTTTYTNAAVFDYVTGTVIYEGIDD